MTLNSITHSSPGNRRQENDRRTCHNTHDYKHAKIPRRPAKKEETKQSLMEQVLRNMPQMPAMPPTPSPKPRRDLWATLGRINEKKETPDGEAK